MTRYTCCDEQRRNAVNKHPTLNGIDYLEVLNLDAPSNSPRQCTLLLHCLKPVPTKLSDPGVPGGELVLALTLENVHLSGGERVRDVQIEWIAIAAKPPEEQTNEAERAFFTALPKADHILLVRTNSRGDYSPYQLRLQRSKSDQRAPEEFDPQLAEVTFSFKVECPSDFDCKPQQVCAKPVTVAPDINYLAKDYASFRRLMLDRLTQLLPDWRARTPADLGVALVELLAYAGDHLSYWQDAVATEAYLNTARRRTSLRRHALLVDYALHEGSNARVWVQLKLAADTPQDISLAGLRFLSRVPGLPSRISADSSAYRDAFAAQPVVFEPLHPEGKLQLADTTTVTLYPAHDTMYFYTWGDSLCCLPKGATSATLSGHFDNLQTGAVLIFEEVKGSSTGLSGDADPTHRHAVRLTSVHQYIDEQKTKPLVDPLYPNTKITEIEWARADALPFPLCLSAIADTEHGGGFIDNVAVAHGNIILADHGLSVRDESLGSVPPARLSLPAEQDADRCDPASTEWLPARYRPQLAQRPLTHAGTIQKSAVDTERRTHFSFDPDAPATQALKWRNAEVLPMIQLTSTINSGSKENWEAQRDLLNSKSYDTHFVVESEHDGSAFLRFGDDEHGKRPESETAERKMTFTAHYRVGQGLDGNIGANALAHVVTDDERIVGVCNPLPARGGSEAESAEQIRRRAPQAFRTQKERAVTPEDYAAVAGRFDDVQRAAATPRWTGSWHTLFVTIDREGGQAMDAQYRSALETFVEPYRMAGHDLVFNDPIYVPLEIKMTVCVAPHYFRSEVHTSLLQVLSNQELADGRRGLFHPDAFTFGQPIYLSPLYAAARSVPGVETVQVTHFARQGQANNLDALRKEVMELGRLEIARLDNDRNFPERGILHLSLHGGK